MIFDFDPYELWKKGLCIFSLIFFSFIALHIFTNVIKSKDTICDSEKQSKFILESLKADGANDTQGIWACEQMSLRLYCK